MDEFYKTRAGRQFIDSTMPRIAEELEKLNSNLETIARLFRLLGEGQYSTPPVQGRPPAKGGFR